MSVSRSIVIGSAVFAAAASLAAPAGAGQPQPVVCKPPTVGGHHWVVYRFGSDCGTADALVRGLASVNAPSGNFYNLADKRFHLTAYKSWKCAVLSPTGTKAKVVACAKGSARINGRELS